MQVGPGDEVDWLRSDLEESPVIAIKKKSLVNKLDDLARREILTSTIIIMIAIEKKSVVNKMDDLARREIITIVINVMVIQI